MRNSASKGTVLALFMLAFGYSQAQEPARSAPAAGQTDARSGGDVLQEQIVAQERAGLDSLKTGNLTAFASSIADEAVFVDAQGPAGKAEIVQHTAEFRLHDYTMAGVRFVPLSSDSGLIVYLLTMTGTSHGKEFAAKVHVSAIWMRRGGAWTCVFSQETGAR
ncbi:MAG: nuclear transport factor 2 family protein [Bryobacteraceae bacterium]